MSGGFFVGRTPVITARILFVTFLQLGLTSFGGPIAHLGHFRREMIRRGWLDEQDYLHIVSLCQLLPGPTSSQVGMAIGMLKGGALGAAAAWLGFTLPSAFLMVALGWATLKFGQNGWGELDIRGLKAFTAAVVAQAVWSMVRPLLNDPWHWMFLSIGTGLALGFSGPWVQPAMVLAFGLLGGLVLRKPETKAVQSELKSHIRPSAALGFLIASIALLVALPMLRSVLGSAGALFDSFYRSGALVFGGGHVVLPLLREETIARTHWVTAEQFVAGYGLVQLVPGPLFSFAAYLGMVAQVPLHPVLSASIALTGIFLPSYLWTLGIWPFWNQLRANRRLQAAFLGIQIGVVGLLIAALYTPVLTEAIHAPRDLIWVFLALGLLIRNYPVWIVALITLTVAGLFGK